MNDQAWWSMMRAPARSRLRDAADSRISRARSPGRAENGDRLNDRRDVRIDARVSERAGVCRAGHLAAQRPSGFTRIEDPEDDASVSHPHGEALGPGARSECAEREKHAFGGTRSLGSHVLVLVFAHAPETIVNENECVNENVKLLHEQER